ncbi:tape measure protein [Acinetobacter nectaris]|uniref:tape measure protein n=1 Tax=Acinetobacter nectaris TaxID=1219382 RepID=UPI001F42BB2E|nr:tape measure protein [Acinetobacter nectaris]MCF9035195.1 tape measure protein [Acinetobacter nectaris]
MAEAQSRLVIEISSDNAKKNAEALDSALKGVDKSGNDASNSIKSFGENANKSSQGITALTASAKKLAVVMGGYLSISEAIQKSDVYTGLQNRLKLVTKSQSELNQAMTDTFKIAQNTHQSWESAAQVYQGFANNAKVLGLTMQHTAQITETVSKAIAISGSSAMASEAALVQFNQALSAGALRGEDLNSVLEQAPGLAKAIAQGMGITVGQLRTVAATGAITSEAIVKALDKSKASVDQLFAKTSPTLGQSFTVLSNEVTKFVGETGKASGSAKALADGIQFIATNFNTFATLGISALMGMITAQIVKQTIAIGTSIITWNAETRAVLANNAAKMTALTVGRSLIGVFGGPVGLGVTVAGAAAAYLLMRDNTNQSTQALIENSKYAQQTTADLLKLQGAQKRGAQEDLGKTYGDLAKKMKELSGQYNAQVIDIQNSNKENYQVVEISNKVRQGIISKGEALRELNKIPTVTPDQIDGLSDVYDKYTDTSKALLDVKGKLDSLKTGMDQSSEAARQAAANQEMYNQKIRDLKKLTDTQNLKTQYQLNTEKLNGGTERGARYVEFIVKWREDNKIPFNQNLTKEQKKISDDQFNLQDKLKDTQEDNARAAKELTKEKERQVKLDIQSNDQSLRGVQIVQAFLKAGLGKTQALAMAAQVGRENDFNDKYLFGSHIDANNKKTNMGMLSFQGTERDELIRELRSKELLNDDGTIKRTQASLDAQAEFLVKRIMTNSSYKKSKDALSNSSLGYSDLSEVIGKNYVRWDYDGNKIGVSKANAAKTKERNYFNNLQGIFNKNGDSSDIDVSKMGADEDKLYEIKLQLAEKFYTKDQKLQQDHDKELRDIGLTYTGAEKKEKLEQSESQFQNQKKLNDLQFEQSVNGWSWVGQKKLEMDANVKKATIDASVDLTEKQKQIAKKGIDDQYAYDLTKFKEAQQAKIAEFNAQISQISQDARKNIDAIVEFTKPMDLQGRLKQINKIEIDSTNKSYDDQTKMNGAIARDTSLGPDEKHAEILKVEQAFEDQRTAIALQGAKDRDNASNEVMQKQLSSLNSLVSSTSTAWSSMTSIIKDKAGEQSGVYKTMFAMQQAFAIASATINAFQAYSQIMGSEWYLDIVSKETAASVVLGMGMANVGMIAAQTISGFSEGGYTGDGGVFEPAGVVHKGEVVFSQADIARLGGVSAVEGIRKGVRGYSDGGVVGGASSSISSQLSSNSGQSQGDVNISVNVADSGVTTSGASTDNQKQLGQMIGNVVRTVIRQEQRQGGLLSK